MGRQSAGEGFLRGVLAHADVDRVCLWNVFDTPPGELAPLLQRLGPPTRPVEWIGPADRAAIADVGAVSFPTPEIAREAWARRALGAGAYSLTGVTHTIAELAAIDAVAQMLIAPLEPWDALVCTSPAVKQAVETQLEAVAGYLAERLGASRIPPAQLVTIPLGVHTADFAFDGEARRRWREALDVPQDAVCALHFGRFSLATKLNPAPMGLALQQAAERAGQPLYWILFGGAKQPEDDAAFRAAAAAFCPDVRLRFVDELDPRAHGPIWSAADLFLSFSDNIQESFGLTVIEAMAAGLPCVVSDWDGYRHSVRHGEDGFRIRTTTPRPGLGRDLAYRYAHGLSTYAGYATAQSQMTAVDVPEAAETIAALIDDPQLRARLGAAAAERARTAFDWRVIIPQHQALWAELARRRAAAPAQPPRGAGDNPWALDPFRMFAGYPTASLGDADGVRLARPLTSRAVAAILARPSVMDAAGLTPTLEEAQALIAALSADRPTPVGDLVAGFPPELRAIIERGLVWLAKYDVVRIERRDHRS